MIAPSRAAIPARVAALPAPLAVGLLPARAARTTIDGRQK